jgi:hypothetical protein
MSDDQPDAEPKVLDKGFTEPTSREETEESKVTKEMSHQKGDKLTMEVKVASPFTSYFSGQAFSLSATNATGPFDILPTHHNFISLLEPCTLVIRSINGLEQKIDISGGLLHVKSDRTTVFLDI